MEYIYLHNSEDCKVSALKSRDFVPLWPLFLKNGGQPAVKTVKRRNGSKKGYTSIFINCAWDQKVYALKSCNFVPL